MLTTENMRLKLFLSPGVNPLKILLHRTNFQNQSKEKKIVLKIIGYNSGNYKLGLEYIHKYFSLEGGIYILGILYYTT